MVGGAGSPQRGSITEDTGTSILKNNTIPTWMKAVNRTPTKDHISYKQFIREEKPIVTAKYPFLTSSQIERKLRLEWQTTMRGGKGRYRSNRSSPHKSTSAEWEHLVGEVDITEVDCQERVFSPKLGSRLGTKTYGGGASWIHQSLTPPKIIQKGPTKVMNGILSRSTEKPRGSTGKVSFQQLMPPRERSKSESSMSDERQPTDRYTPKCNMRKISQEEEKFGGDIYSLSDSDSDKEHHLTTLHKSPKGSAAKRGSATKSARRMSHAHTRVRKSKDHQKTKCALMFGQEKTGTMKKDEMSQFLSAELSDSDDERERQLLGLEGNVLITERKESERKQKKASGRPTATGRQRTITSMFHIMETFSNKDNLDKTRNEKCPKPLSDADPVESKEPEPTFNTTECVQSESDVDMDGDDIDDGASNHFPESETTELFSKISKIKQRVLGTVVQATPQNTEGANKLIKMIQTPSTDSKSLSDLTTPANPDTLVQHVIKKASKVPHKKRPNKQVSQSENTLEDTRVTVTASSPKQKKARRSLDVTNTATSLDITCNKRKTRSVTQPLESPLAEPFFPNKGRNKKSSIASFKQNIMSVNEDSVWESPSEVEIEFVSTPAQKNIAPPNSKTSMCSPKFLKDELKIKTPVLLTSPKRIHAEPLPNVRRTPVRTPVKRTSTNLNGCFPVTPSPRSNVRRAPATPIFRRSPRLSNEEFPVIESPGPIPVFKTPKGIPGKAKSRKSLSPKLISKVDEEIYLKPRGLNNDRSTLQDTSLPRALNTDTHHDNLVPSEPDNGETTPLDTSLSGGLNVGKSVYSHSSVPCDLNNDNSINSDTKVSSGLNKATNHQNMDVSSFYKSRLKQKKDNILSNSSQHSKLPKFIMKTSHVKDSKAKGPNNTLNYFGFGEDLDDNDVEKAKNEENSGPIECIKEKVKPDNAKSGRHKTKDAPEMERPDAAKTRHGDYDIDNEQNSVVRPTSPENKNTYMKNSKAKGLKVKGASNTLDYFGFGEELNDQAMDESNAKENSDPIECYQDEYETDSKCIRENVKPVKARSARHKTKDALEMESSDYEIDDKHIKESVKPARSKKVSPDADETYNETNDKYTKRIRVPAKAKGARKTVKDIAAIESPDTAEIKAKAKGCTEVSSHPSTLPVQPVVRLTSPENKQTYLKTSKVKGSKGKGPSNTLDYFGFGEDVDDHDVDEANNKENSDPVECHQNEDETNNKCINENMKPVKAQSGRHKTKDAPEKESPDAADTDEFKVDDKHIKENRVSAQAKRGTEMGKDTPETESLNAAEICQNDYKVNGKSIKENVKPAKTKSGRHKTKDASDASETEHDDSRNNAKHMKEKLKPAKTKSSRHRMKDDTAESDRSDYETDAKHIKEGVKPARSKKVRRRTKDALEKESQDAAENHYDDYRIVDTQNILNLNPLNTLVEGFRKKSMLQFGEPYNWDSCLQEDSEEEKLVDLDENVMLAGHLTTIAEDEKSDDDTPPPTQSQSAKTAVQDALQNLRKIASPNILNMDEFEDYELEEVLSSLKSSQQSSQVSDLSSLSFPSDQENAIHTQKDEPLPIKGADDTQYSTSTKKDATAFKKPTNNSSGDRMKGTQNTCPKMTYGKKVNQMGQGDGLSWASDLFDDIVKEYEPSQKVDTGLKEKPKSKHNSVRRKKRDMPKTPDVDVCGLFEETPRTSARRLLTSSQHQTDSNFQDLFLAKDSSSFFM